MGFLFGKIIKMKLQSINKILIYLFALVWFINGFYCKFLNLVPRHKEIVGKILGTEFSSSLTKAIGVFEVAMAIWIVSKIKSRLNAITQILIIGTMNILEFFLAPDLLLWGKFNSLFAFIFIIIIWFNEFILNKKISENIGNV